MASSQGERAALDAITYGKALIKFVTKNDAGVTGAHQYGFHLPMGCWQLFSPHPPIKGRNDEHPVQVTWQDGRVTDSKVKWYGDKTRFEYRLTGFGRGFPFRTPENVGDLLILVPTSHSSFNGYVLSAEEDLEDLEAQLGIDLTSTRLACYERGATRPSLRAEAAEECIDRQFGAYAESLDDFPLGTELTERTWQVLADCDPTFEKLSSDKKLVVAKEAEYELFKRVEKHLVWDDIQRSPRSVDDYVGKANSIVNRRKSRAGRSLENHLGMILREEEIRYSARPSSVEGTPDVIIPGEAEYADESFPVAKLFVVAVKTTLKDRWGQVLKEGPRVKKRYLVTVQPGISKALLDRMHTAGIVLVVPKEIQAEYPASSMRILTLEEFINLVRG